MTAGNNKTLIPPRQQSYENRSYNWKANFLEKQCEIIPLIANSFNSG